MSSCCRDASPIVFSEAAAYGLPIVATETGGVGQVVHDGENGVLLPLAAEGAAYAEVIARIIADEATYARMSLASRDAYDTHLSWDAWGRRMATILADVLATSRTTPVAPTRDITTRAAR